MDIESLNMSEKTIKVLKQNGINTVEDLKNTRSSQVLKFRQLGRISLQELIDKMKTENIEFKYIDELTTLD